MQQKDWDKPQMQALSDAMHAKIKKDAAGDWFIQGLEGDIYCADGVGYAIGVCHTTRLAYRRTKEVLMRFAVLRQNGDTEGVFYLNRLPTQDEACTLRKRLKIRKIRQLSDEARQKNVEVVKAMNEQRLTAISAS